MSAFCLFEFWCSAFDGVSLVSLGGGFLGFFFLSVSLSLCLHFSIQAFLTGFSAFGVPALAYVPGLFPLSLRLSSILIWVSAFWRLAFGGLESGVVD